MHAIQSQEQSSEATVQRLREELNLAQMAQATASSSASEADRRLAEVYAEAQAAVQRVQVDSNQQNALLKQELETSQNNYAIQGGKLKTHITELAEQKLFAEKLTGEIKEQQRMLAEQRTLLQEHEQTRVLMSDYRSLKDEFELLKERRERKESPKVERRTEGKMPEPEEPPNFSSFPSKPQDNKANESKDASQQQEDPFNRNDPWGGYKPTGEAGVFDDLRAKPNKETPEGNPMGENAGPSNPAEAILRELITALGGNASKTSSGSRVTKKLKRLGSLSSQHLRSTGRGEPQSAKKFVRRPIDQTRLGIGSSRYTKNVRIRRTIWPS